MIVAKPQNTYENVVLCEYCYVIALSYTMKAVTEKDEVFADGRFE